MIVTRSSDRKAASELEKKAENNSNTTITTIFINGPSGIKVPPAYRMTAYSLFVPLGQVET
jgi:hypothetical protein